MPRRAAKDDQEIYRVVVQTVYPAKSDSPLADERRVVNYFGPYRTFGAASGMKTREARLTSWQKQSGITKIIWVEKTPVSWTAIP